MSFTQPICRPCWDQREPGADPVRIPDAPRETCAFCGKPSSAGIYTRVDPSSVPYPQDVDG